jgi:adenine phosphoribosyltransferase
LNIGVGTAHPTGLIEKLGGEIAGLTFLIELADLKGRDNLSQYGIHTVITY